MSEVGSFLKNLFTDRDIMQLPFQRFALQRNASNTCLSYILQTVLSHSEVLMQRNGPFARSAPDSKHHREIRRDRWWVSHSKMDSQTGAFLILSFQVLKWFNINTLF